MWMNRRALLTGAAGGIGAMALQTLQATAAPKRARARRVISLFQFGGPSQLELFDHKPQLRARHGQELPPSVRGAAPISGLTREQKGFPLVGPVASFAQHGQSGAWVSDLLPHTARLVDRLCIIRSLTTDAVAHDPALLLMQTGNMQPGRPAVGSWVSYGLGSENRDLPAYVVLTSKGSGDKDTQPLGSRLWSSGFLPSRHQGVPFRSKGDPVLYLTDPPGVDRGTRRAMLDTLGTLNQRELRRTGDPEISTRIAQYELAFRMQTAVPDLMDLGGEPAHVIDRYGPDARTPGTYAWNCLLARRLAERGVRFVQLFHRGWDQHRELPEGLRLQCQDTDQPTAALVEDLAARGLLDDTLVFWGGEFGRTAYCQGKLDPVRFGRDHHGRCFSAWLAGGGFRGGVVHGETDDLGYNVVRNAVPLRDLHATMLHCLGLDPERLTFRVQGLEARLTGVNGTPRVLHELLT